MSAVTDIIRWSTVVILFVLMVYACYYARDEFDIPPFLTDLLPAGMAAGWNDQTIVLPDVAHSADLWLGSQVLAGELTDAQWIRDHTTKADRFVDDIGGAEAIMGMTTRSSLVGGDWANAPDPTHNMEVAGRIYSTSNASEAHKLAVDNGCTYVIMPDRRLNTGMYDNYANATKFEDADYFQMVYKNDNVTIYRVLP